MCDFISNDVADRNGSSFHMRPLFIRARDYQSRSTPDIIFVSAGTGKQNLEEKREKHNKAATPQ